MKPGRSTQAGQHLSSRGHLRQTPALVPASSLSEPEAPICQAGPSGCRGGSRGRVNLLWNINGSIRSAVNELSNNLPLLRRRATAGARGPRRQKSRRAKAAGRNQEGERAGRQGRGCPTATWASDPPPTLNHSTYPQSHLLTSSAPSSKILLAVVLDWDPWMASTQTGLSPRLVVSL